MNYRRLSGILFICFPLIVQIPFTILTVQFNYPDILREPPSVILTNFLQGGSSLLLTWYAYALSILIFMAGIFAYDCATDRTSGASRLADRIGLISAALQLIALLRWTFLVPFLARDFAQAEGSPAAASIAALFQAQHNFLGVGIGEHLGQLTMVIWTILMIRRNSQHVVLKSVGYLSALLLFVGLGEHLAVALNANPGLLAHGALYGFICWSIWLVSLGISLVRQPKLGSSVS